MALHTFVIMPFGNKEGIDFDKVYIDFIKPALKSNGYEVFRADEEMQAGDIKTDMFQELLLADLVIADLSIDNPNVWYELGVRHALRARGVILIQSKRKYQPFDIYTDRKLHYHVRDGVPDPTFLERDKVALAEMANKTMAFWSERKISPVYQLLPNLQEPDWKSLRVGQVREFWERHDAWENRVELARKTVRIGDVLVLADEAPVVEFRAEAWIKAGEILRRTERFDFALEQLDKGLKIEPGNLKGLQEKGICLQRLACASKPGHSLDRARMHYRDVLKTYPNDPETWALLARVDKDAWIAAWRQSGKTPEQMRKEAAYEDALLRGARGSRPLRRGVEAVLLPGREDAPGEGRRPALRVHAQHPPVDLRDRSRAARQGRGRRVVASRRQDLPLRRARCLSRPVPGCRDERVLSLRPAPPTPRRHRRFDEVRCSCEPEPRVWWPRRRCLPCRWRWPGPVRRTRSGPVTPSTSTASRCATACVSSRPSTCPRTPGRSVATRSC